MAGGHGPIRASMPAGASGGGEAGGRRGGRAPPAAALRRPSRLFPSAPSGGPAGVRTAAGGPEPGPEPVLQVCGVGGRVADPLCRRGPRFRPRGSPPAAMGWHAWAARGAADAWGAQGARVRGTRHGSRKAHGACLPPHGACRHRPMVAQHPPPPAARPARAASTGPWRAATRARPVGEPGVRLFGCAARAVWPRGAGRQAWAAMCNARAAGRADSDREQGPGHSGGQL